MANLSSRTGLTPVQTTIALANDATTTIQNFGAYDAQELIGYVSVDADTDYRAAVRVTVVKNGAGTYEVAASDVAGDDISGSPIVTFAMSGSNLQATLPNFTGFVSASIKYHLVSPVTNANYPLSIDGGQILSGTVAAARLPLATSSDYGLVQKSGIVRATRSAAQSIAHNSETVVQFNTASINTLSEFNTGTYRFIPASDGYYSITVSLLMAAVTDGTYVAAFLRKNASNINQMGNYSPAPQPFQLLIQDVVYLLTTDYVDVRIYQNSGTSRNLNPDANSTYFLATKILV
jgi:hypothetical protein